MALVVVAVVAATTLGLVVAALTTPDMKQSPAASSPEPSATSASASYSGLLGPFDAITFSPPPPREVHSHSWGLRTLASDTSQLQMLWRLPAVAGNPCPGTGKVPDALEITFQPTPREAYEIIRAAPALQVSEELPFTLAGYTGRFVDITVDPAERDRCRGPVEDAESVILTTAGRGGDGWGIGVPFDVTLRVGIVEVAGNDLLVSATAWTGDTEGLEQVWALVDTMTVSVREPSVEAGSMSLQRQCQDLDGLQMLFSYGVEYEDDPAAWEWDRTLAQVSDADAACGNFIRSLMRAPAGATPSP
jgi:hypothetical protein